MKPLEARKNIFKNILKEYYEDSGIKDYLLAKAVLYGPHTSAVLDYLDPMKEDFESSDIEKLLYELGFETFIPNYQAAIFDENNTPDSEIDRIELLLKDMPLLAQYINYYQCFTHE